MVGQINYPPVTAKNAAEDRAQQGHQHFGAARGGHHIEHELFGSQSPDPAFVAIGAPTRLVHIQNRFARQLLLQLLHRLCHRPAHFFPGFLGASQADLDAQHVGQHGFHQAPGQPADDRPVGDQRRQPWAEVSGNFFCQRRARRLAAVAANYVRALILGDVRLHRGHFGHLMPSRLAFRNHPAGLLRQAPAATSALLGQQHLHGTHLGDGDQASVMPWMSGLGTRFPLALMCAATRSLIAGQSVGGRGFGGVGGIAFAQCQLPFQIRDLFFGIRDLLFTLADLLFTLGDFTAEFFVLSQ
jgi:hypothetical protein